MTLCSWNGLEFRNNKTAAARIAAYIASPSLETGKRDGARSMNKNPIDEIGIWKARRGNDTRMIVTAYTRGGTVQAFDGFGCTVIGRARGGGYDKTSTALGNAIEKIFGVTLDADGAQGEMAIIESAKAHGIEVISLRNLVWKK